MFTKWSKYESDLEQKLLTSIEAGDGQIFRETLNVFSKTQLISFIEKHINTIQELNYKNENQLTFEHHLALKIKLCWPLYDIENDFVDFMWNEYLRLPYQLNPNDKKQFIWN